MWRHGGSRDHGWAAVGVRHRSAQARAAGKLGGDSQTAADNLAGNLAGNGAGNNTAAPPEHPMWVLRIVTGLFAGFAALQIVLPLGFVHEFRAAGDASKVDHLGQAMGTISIVLTFVQYIPQLLTTYRLKGCVRPP